jgi:prepilin signal peptidase PulO-like enzyme (type II secretory pathway)
MTLPYRLFVTNTAGACFLIWSFWIGYAQRVTSADVAHMWAIIGAMFLYGVISTFRLAFRLERARRAADMMTILKKTKTAKGLLIKGEHLGTIVSAYSFSALSGTQSASCPGSAVLTSTRSIRRMAFAS